MSEKNVDDNAENHLSLEDENLLKDSMIFLQEEYNIKKAQHKILKQELSEAKKQFQSQIQEYQKEIKLTIEKEKEIQISLSKISKMKKRRAIIIKNSFNKKFYLHLLEISTNVNKEKILKNYFSLILLENNQETRTVKELIEILKNEEEIKQLLYYSYKIYYDLRINDEKQYYELKQKFENYLLELKDLDGVEYPFDEMFECLGIIFEVIECEKKIKENNLILNKLIEKKNAKFIEIKSIEHRIKNSYKNIKKIQSHIKIIHTFYDNFKEKSAIHDYNSLKELIENIEEYKKIDFDYNKINPNFDAITSLTFGTYCTQSEDSSIKSSNLETKNKLKSNNNDQNKIFSQFNTYENSNNINNNLKNNKNNKKFSKNLKEAKNENQNKNNFSNKFKNNILINENSKENKKSQLKDNSTNNNKYNNNEFIEIKSNKSNNKQNKNTKSSEEYNNKSNINKNKDKDIKKVEKNKSQTEEEKSQKDLKENKAEGKEIINHKKYEKKFENLNLLGSKVNQLKYKEPDESAEVTMPKENLNKIYDIVNTEYNFNDSSVCDEMISFNYDGGNMGRNTTNDYINKIGVKNNVILSQQLYKNKFFMRRNNNNDFGKLKIEKSIDSSNCCVSCT